MLCINSSKLYLLNFDLRQVEKVIFYNFLYITELERKMSITTASANILEGRGYTTKLPTSIQVLLLR